MGQNSRNELSIPLTELLPSEERYRSNTTVSKRFGLVLLTAAGTSWFFLLMMNGSTIGLVGMLFYIGLFLARKVKQKRAIEKNQIAVNLLNDMRYEDASLIFEELTETEQNTNSHPVYIFNRGVAFLLSGHYLRAFSLFNSVLKTNIFSGTGAYEPILLSDMATCLLLNNQIEEARPYISRANTAVQLYHQPTPSEDEGYLVFVQALYALKSGQPELAFIDILDNWSLAEAKLRLPFRRALSLLLAFSADQTGRPEHVGSVLSQIEFSHKAVQEFRWVAQDWPEMGDFIRRQLGQ